jgi:mono/diheme cytochrome c family protein
VLKKFYIALSMILMMGAFQNCDMKSSHTEYNEFSSKGCGGIVGEAYKKTYYNTFRNSCTNCHDSGGVSGRPFASADFDEALTSFISIGRAKIEGNATNAGHKPPNTGAHHQAMIDAAQVIWTKAEGLAGDCFMPSGLRTVEKRLPSNVYTTTPGNGAAWPVVTFDLRNDLEGANELPFSPNLQVSFEIRRYRAPNEDGVIVDMGYEVKNPKARVNGMDVTEKYQIKDIRIIKNGSLMNEFTFFSEIDKVITGAADTLLIIGGHYSALTPLGPINNQDMVGLQFARLDSGPHLTVAGTGGGGSMPGGGGSPVTIPMRVTHADLLSANPVLGVFNNRCLSCHRNGNEAGGLNLQDYVESAALRTTIRSRMNNPANPMPPSGLIQDNGISLQVIDVWISSGAPQN